MRLDWGDRFERDMADLPANVRKTALKQLGRLRDNPAHPSLHLRKLHGTGLHEANINMKYHSCCRSRAIWR